MPPPRNKAKPAKQVERAGERRPRPRLTQTDVVAAAQLVADERGVDAITMASVARELGVTPMALYQHVTDKEHMLTLLLDAQLVPIQVRTDGPWDERLRDLTCR